MNAIALTHNWRLTMNQAETFVSDVPVYQFKFYSVHTGEMVLSDRYATLDAIQLVNGVPVLQSKQLVPQAELDSNGFHDLDVS